MNQLRFDGRVAVVTGAARGLGRAYADLLAARGASVVVNDVEPDGATPVDDTSDIARPEGARALIETTVERFGRVDILVNNAGIIRWGGPPEVDEENVAAHLAVHTLGSFHTARAAWPHMVEQGYGRIVMTTSTGMLGLPNNTGYATAKGGVLGLARSLATAGAKAGIKVNLIAPAATTRMAGDGGPDMPPELVAPMVAYLASEDCPVTGELYTAGAGRFARLFIASTPGYVHEGAAPAIEDVAANWATINDEAGYEVPRDLMAWSRSFLSHLPTRPGDQAGR